MLLEKYAPQTSKDFVGNASALQEIRKWLSTWQKGGALILSGPSGTGKTLAVKIIAREMNYDVLESNANEERKQDYMKSVAASSLQRSFSLRKKLILLDDMEQLESMKAISDIIEKSIYPVIMITEDLYERNMTAFRKRFDTVKFSKIRYDSISKFLRNVCEKEGIKYDERGLDQLAKMANGDMRAALMDLGQMVSVEMKTAISTGYRDDTNDVFNTVKMIFKSSSMEAVSIAIQKCENPDDVTGWIEENVQQEYDPKGVASSMDFLSKSDIMNTRVSKRQSWQMKKYSHILSFYGTALSKEKPNNSFIRYNFPRYYPRKNEDAMQKFASAMHMSKRKLDMHFVKAISKSRKVVNELELTKDELRSL